ncbi:carbohydrate kinase family protein [Frankia sp. QA3]|uniref:carbohydrate kinase family protein n=1 Tax=Frankia sp. QA3 TaxID=710111 RepID=UPI000269BD7C|nr:carbohydrate kinase family protein [Frankia sp. QA3]EIV93040.1 sugar kinase, ribokinase [Frankia sp. QA3]
MHSRAERAGQPGHVVVAGVVNVQQTVPVDGFPLAYAPVRYATGRLRLAASGVGLNVARTLGALGTPASLATLVGDDPAGLVIRAELRRLGLLGLPGEDESDGRGAGVLATANSAMSAVLVDPHGTRQVHTDLADLATARHPTPVFRDLLAGARLAVLTTAGFVRDLIPVAQAAGVPIAVDVQTIEDADDAYSRPWLAAASLVFCSAERLTASPAATAAALLARHPAGVVLVGMGADGCLLAVRDHPPRHLPARAPHGVLDTTGAGDALCAGFLHCRFPALLARHG